MEKLVTKKVDIDLKNVNLTKCKKISLAMLKTFDDMDLSFDEALLSTSILIQAINDERAKVQAEKMN